MDVRDSESKIPIIIDLHSRIYGMDSLDKIIGILRKYDNMGDIIAVILAGDYGSKDIPQKIEKELNVKVVAFPGSHEGASEAYNYPIKWEKSIVMTPFGLGIAEIGYAPSRTLGEILNSKNLDNILLLPGSTWSPGGVGVYPDFEGAKEIIKKGGIEVIISHEQYPDAMSAIATTGNSLVPVWYAIMEVLKNGLSLSEEDKEKIEDLYQMLLRKNMIKINSQIKDAIQAIKRVLNIFYKKDVDESIIKYTLILLVSQGYTVKIGYSQSPQESVDFWNFAMNHGVKLIVHGHIHEDPIIREKHGHKVDNMQVVYPGPAFLGIFGNLYPNKNTIEVINANNDKIIEEYQF